MKKSLKIQGLTGGGVGRGQEHVLQGAPPPPLKILEWMVVGPWPAGNLACPALAAELFTTEPLREAPIVY